MIKFSYATTTSINFLEGEANAIGTGGVNQNYVLGANSAPYISPSEYSTSQQLLADYNAQGSTIVELFILIDKKLL
jgi:hypothetical protein